LRRWSSLSKTSSQVSAARCRNTFVMLLIFTMQFHHRWKLPHAIRSGLVHYFAPCCSAMNRRHGKSNSTIQKQLDDLNRATFEATRQETMRIWPQVQAIPRQTRIPLVDLALPALRRLSRQQFEQFRAAVKTLVESDRETDLFEYMLQKIVVRHLEFHFYPARRPITQFYDLRPLAKDCGVLLAAMAYAGQQDATQAHRAFLQGANLLSHVARSEIPWLPPDHCDLSHLDIALERLSQALPQIKKNVLSACAQTVAADGIIQEREAELLRAIGDTLDCPVPPFVRPQEGAAAA
jgi:hypothetical protein